VQAIPNTTGQRSGRCKSAQLTSGECIHTRDLEAEDHSLSSSHSRTATTAVKVSKARNLNCRRLELRSQDSTKQIVETAITMQTARFSTRAGHRQWYLNESGLLPAPMTLPDSTNIKCAFGQPKKDVRVYAPLPKVPIPACLSNSQQTNADTTTPITTHVTQFSRYHGRFTAESIPPV